MTRCCIVLLLGLAAALELLVWIRVARWLDRHAPRPNRRTNKEREQE